MMIIGFTGSREGMTGEQMIALQRKLAQRLDGDEFHHGMCIGADEQAHRIAHNYEISIVGHPPLINRYMMKVINAEFTKIHRALPYLDRNRDIVDGCQHLYACPKEPEETRSGTWSTIRYARSRGKPVTIFWPNSKVDFGT